MELAQQKLVYTSLAACPMEICYEFYFFRNFVHFKASGLVIFFSLALTSEKHLYPIQKALRAEKKLAPQCCRPPKCVYHQKCAPSCHSTPLPWPIIVCNGRVGGVGGNSFHYILWLVKGGGLSGRRGRTYDDIHTLEADNIRGAGFFPARRAFWIGNEVANQVVSCCDENFGREKELKISAEVDEEDE